MNSSVLPKVLLNSGLSFGLVRLASYFGRPVERPLQFSCHQRQASCFVARLSFLQTFLTTHISLQKTTFRTIRLATGQLQLAETRKVWLICTVPSTSVLVASQPCRIVAGSTCGMLLTFDFDQSAPRKTELSSRACTFHDFTKLQINVVQSFPRAV